MNTLLISLCHAGDLLIYYAFAVFFAACFGGGSLGTVWAGVLGCAVCFALAAKFGQKRALRTLCAAVSFALLALPGAAADRVALVPAAGYTVWLAWRGDFALSAEGQIDRFRLFCRCWPPFALVLGLIWNGQVMLSAALPVAVVAVLGQIFLMRLLRLDLASLRQKEAIAYTLGVLAGLSLLAFGFSRGFVADILRAVYLAVLVPVVQLPLRGVAWVAEHILFGPLRALVAWLMARRTGQPVEQSAVSTSGEAAQKAAENDALLAIDWAAVLSVAGVILVAVLAFLLLRRLAAHRGKATDPDAPEAVRRAAPVREERWPVFFLGPVARVRRAYRAYLRLCDARGVALHPGDTSADVAARAREAGAGFDPEAEAELRALYCAARYADKATAQDAARAAELVRKLEK